jgi:general stress protein 26
MATRASSFPEIQAQFEAYLGDIVYATMTTVDAKGRPRARILIAVWETIDARPVGWLATYKTPVKAAHLANNPHATFSYWSPRQNAVAIDVVSEWVDDPKGQAACVGAVPHRQPRRGRVRPGQFWRAGPSDPQLHVLRLNPWRVQVIRGTDLQSRIWREDEPVERPS